MPDDDFSPDESKPDNVIPFPAMRPNAKLSEAWTAEVETANRKAKTSHRFVSPIDVVGELLKLRGTPTMPWPAAWPDTARRARTYVGDLNAYVGAIGAGKTQKMVQLALAAVGAGLPVLWGNLELGKEQVVARFLGNMAGEHAMHVVDEWPEDRIRHQAAAFTDMLHFVDRYDSTEQQIAAFRDGIEVCWKIYRLPCVWIADHIGQLLTEGDDTRREMLKVGRHFEKLALDTKTFGQLVAQGTKSGQQLLTGKVELESAADAIGAAAESSIMQQVCANVIVGQLYKADDAEKLSGRDLFAKCRHTGREGQVGTEYSKPGGVWSELSYLPKTPSEVKSEQEKQKKDRHRTEKPQSVEEIRRDLNATAASDASAVRRAALLEAIGRHGMSGMDPGAMRSIRGCSRIMDLQRAVQELERAGAIARTPEGRWRGVPR